MDALQTRTARTYAAMIRKGLRSGTFGAPLHQLERLAQPSLLLQVAAARPRGLVTSLFANGREV